MVKRRHLLIAGGLAAAGAVGQARAWQPPPDRASFMVFFAENSAAITERAREFIGKCVRDANGRFDGPVVVTGYTDRGERAPDLAARRAYAVWDRLVTLGIDAPRLSVQAWAEGRLLVDSPPGVPEAQNRRVEMELIRRGWPNCPEDKFQDAGSSRD